MFKAASVWTFACGHDVRGACAVDDNIVALIVNNGFTLRMRGLQLFSSPVTRLPPSSTALIHAGHGVLYTGTTTGYCEMSDTITHITFADNASPVAFASNGDQFFVATANTIYFMNAANPQTRLEGYKDIVSIAAWGQDLFVLIGTGSLFVLNAETRKREREVPLKHSIKPIGIAAGQGRLFLALQDRVLCMDIETNMYTAVLADVRVKMISASAKMLTVLTPYFACNYVFE